MKITQSRNKREGQYQGWTFWRRNPRNGHYISLEKKQHTRGHYSGLKYRGYATVIDMF